MTSTAMREQDQKRRRAERPVLLIVPPFQGISCNALGVSLMKAAPRQLIGRHFDGVFYDDMVPWDNRAETCSAPITEEALDLAWKNVDKIGNYIRTKDFEYWG